MRTGLLALFATTLLAGCALKAPPDAAQIRQDALPNLQLPNAWSADGATPGVVGSDWLASFNDRQLEALVREALSYNADLRASAARVEQAAAYVRQAGATLYPAVQALGRASDKDGSGVDLTGIFVSWEIDLWGRVRAGREAASLQHVAAQLDLIYARQSIAAAVARSWFLATEARMQEALAGEMLAAAEKLAGLTRDRVRVGNASELELRQVQADVEKYRDARRQLRQASEQAGRALETLVGRYPAASIEIPVALPAMPGPVPAGMPAELLERRPDVVAAERRVAAAFQRVEEAKAARLPRLTLGLGLSWLRTDTFVLQNNRDDPEVGTTATLVAPIFLGGALQAQVDVRSAEQQMAIADYGRVGSRAFSEAENAIAGEQALRDREPMLARSVAENDRALELTEVRYRVGSADLRAVAQQQLILYAARTSLLRVRSEQRVQRVNLHLALGGNFELPADKP